MIRFLDLVNCLFMLELRSVQALGVFVINNHFKSNFGLNSTIISGILMYCRYKKVDLCNYAALKGC